MKFAKRAAITAWGVMRRDLAIQRSYGSIALVGLASGLLGIVIYRFVGELVTDSGEHLLGGGYFAFVVAGLVLYQMTAAVAASVANGLSRDAAEGTLEIALAAGAPAGALLAGAGASAFLLSSLQATLYATVGLLWLAPEAPTYAPSLPAALLCTVLSVLAMLPLGVLGAAVWLVTRRAGFVIGPCLGAMTLLGGVYFPATLLPSPLAAIAEWVPLRIGADALREALFGGASLGALRFELLQLAGFAAVGLV
ncbi:MAG: ABC transporter permease, partial [Myxococcales bacterium]|nr:ABC transporter permease [Myxococcales bacterium]